MKISILNKILIGAVLFVVLIAGVTMIGKGTSLSGTVEAADKASVSDDIQNITSELTANGYPDLVVQKGIPVRWNLKAEASVLNSCNNALVIPEYGIEKKLESGDNIIEFTPDKNGAIPYSCWMGMINAQINVVDDIDAISTSDLPNQTVAASTAGSGAGCCRVKPTGN